MKKTLALLMPALLVAVIFASLLGGKSATASVQGSVGARWEASMKLQPEAYDLALQDRSAWSDPLRKLGVSAGVSNGWLSLKGQKDVAQISSALFDTAAPWADFLGGVVELTIYLPSNGKPLTLNLEARNTAGYRWDVLQGDGVYVQNGESTFAMRYRGKGVPSIQTIRLSASGKGDTAIRLIYHQRFADAVESNARVAIWLTESATFLELSDPTPVALMDDQSPAEDPSAYAELDQIRTALPTSWDWRTQGIVPDVRNQGGCGSCWSFGTVGVMESAIVKGGGPMTDLSEQFLIDCNKDGWDCRGGLTATKYHYNVLGLNQTSAGAVLETTLPYTAPTNSGSPNYGRGSCAVSYSHPYQASDWKFIVPSEFTMPTVTQIKNAIYTYGPITAGVCADSGWDYYSGGVYNPTSNQCGGSTNHQIVLVGWDDATSSWILRNSWGPGWGEAGYMRIKWDTTGSTSRVGEGTSWVTYTASNPNIPVLVSPSGTTVDTTPTFTWTRVTNATQYRFQVLMGSTTLYTQTVSSSACGIANCTSTPATVLSNAGHKWRAQAYVSGVWQTYSAFKAFTVSTSGGGFESDFNGSSTGWSAVAGLWSVYNSINYYSTGQATTVVSARHTGSYGNFTYEVKMRRSGTCTTCANRIIVRGNPASLTSTFGWKPSYIFQYSNDGSFSVFEMSSSGTSTTLKAWTASSAIIKNSWNTLKVVANGSSLKFYINNVLVWNGLDSTIASGSVGFGFYRNIYAGSMYVDWAKLIPITADENPYEEVAPGLEVGGGSIDQSP